MLGFVRCVPSDGSLRQCEIGGDPIREDAEQSQRSRFRFSVRHPAGGRSPGRAAWQQGWQSVPATASPARLRPGRLGICRCSQDRSCQTRSQPAGLAGKDVGPSSSGGAGGPASGRRNSRRSRKASAGFGPSGPPRPQPALCRSRPRRSAQRRPTGAALIARDRAALDVAAIQGEVLRQAVRGVSFLGGGSTAKSRPDYQRRAAAGDDAFGSGGTALARARGWWTP